MAVIDDLIKTNADFHYKAGLSPKIIRKSNGSCCDWCSNLVGVYDYEDVKDTGNAVFRRHRHCDCTVIYDPGDGGKKRNVHTHKEWIDSEKDDRIKERKNISEAVSESSTISRIAREKAAELGYNPLSDSEVVNILRKDSKEWMQTLSDDEIKAIKKYTYNGKDLDGLRLFEKINKYLENTYSPINEKDEEIIIRNIANIDNALLKNTLSHDMIVYRNDSYPELLEGKISKFLSTSVTKNGVIGKTFNIIIIVPKGTEGSYVESLSKYPKQREFLLNKGSRLDKLYSKAKECIYIVRKNKDEK